MKRAVAIGTLATMGMLALLLACRTQPSGSVHIDTALERLVPSDTVFITGARLAAIQDTPVYQKWLSQVALAQLDDFARRTGVDPRKDVAEVISCSNGKSAVLLARGNFRPNDLERRLEANGATKLPYKGRTLLGNEQGAVMFLNPSTAVAGSTLELRSIIDQRSSHGMPPVLRDKLASIGAGSQVWAAVAGGLQRLNIGVPDDSNLGSALRLLQGINSAAAGLDLRHGLDLKAEADCRTDRDAKRLNDAVRGIVGLGRLSTPDNQPELLKLYDAIKVSQQQTHVQVVAQIAPDLVDKFLDMWLKRK